MCIEVDSTSNKSAASVYVNDSNCLKFIKKHRMKELVLVGLFVSAVIGVTLAVVLTKKSE